MKRKVFIRNTAIAATLPFFLNALAACNIKPKSKQRVFVIIQLIGGNDGLNTLIPLDNYAAIKAARPNLFIAENKVLPLKGTPVTGLHPSLQGIRDMYADGLIHFVQGVGYQNSNYSHFRSSDIWLTGSDAGQVLYTGWMARYLQQRYVNYPVGFPNTQHPDPPAIKIGDMGTYLFQGDMDMSIVIDPNSAFETPDEEASANRTDTLAGCEVKSIRDILLQTKGYSTSVKKGLATTFTHSKRYPKQGENPLADQLKTVAQLINAGLETPVYLVDLKGFDTHDAQVDPTNTAKGPHADLLAKLSQAVTCFWDDIVSMGKEEEVAGMSFSEFGRRIMSNASYGTDHGSSQPVMFFGAGINSGITGSNPDIPDKVMPNDNLAMQFDYRSLYTAILKQWLQVPDAHVKDILAGQFKELQLFKQAIR